jgi:hypothetical protein
MVAFQLILSMNANFCARVSCTKWKAVRKFFRSGLSEKIIDLCRSFYFGGPMQTNGTGHDPTEAAPDPH